MSLVCQGARRVYGARRRMRVALERVTLRAGAGEIVGIIGPNGAGKTTLLNLIAGRIPLSSGDITVTGHRAGTLAARRQVGLAADPPLAPAELSGIEWLTYLASHRAGTPAERVRLVRDAIEAAELGEFVGRRIGTYSRGMAQRLALGAARLTGPAVVLLDETLSGIDPLVQRRLREGVRALAAAGRLVLVASHDLGAVERVATRAVVLARGTLRADVSMAVLVGERIAEVCFTGAGVAAAERLVARYPGAARTGTGVSVPLRQGLTMESLLAACRDERLAVAGSRVRYRALEDLLVAATEGEAAS